MAVRRWANPDLTLSHDLEDIVALIEMVVRRSLVTLRTLEKRLNAIAALE